MSLASAMSTAQAIFNNSGTQSSVVSKNIANTQNPDYARRSATVSTGGNGAMIGEIGRAGNTPLLRQTIESSSIASGQRTLLDGLAEIKNLMGGNDNEFSPAKLIAVFRTSLDAFAAKANDTGIGIAVTSSAKDLAATLNTSSNKLQLLRKDADDQIGQNVGDLNSLLAKFETVNNRVKNATAAGADVNDALDERDALVKKISEIVGVTSYTRGDNADMVLYTTAGVTLFEAIPRKVTFQQTTAFDASSVGNGVYIDGVAVKAGDAANTTAKGSLQASLQLRDKVAPTFQSQLDEIARGLINAFAETGPTGALVPRTGLFTYADTSGVQQTAIPSTTGTDANADGNPDAGSLVVAGLASRILVNPAVVPPAGTPDKLRDGGINGAAYVVNTSGSSYGGLLDKYNENLEAPMVFDTLTEIADAPNLVSLASDSMGWLEQYRSTATSSDEVKTALLTRTLEAYSSMTGVSLDEELSLLLDIEQSYKAGAKLVAAVDEMMKALLDIAS